MKNKFKPIDRKDYKPLYAQLGDLLIDYIKENQLSPGSPFPSQNELIEAFGVSQATVRQALQRLATEGFIVRFQGKGAFVAEPKMSQSLNSLLSLEQKFAQRGLKVTNELISAEMAHPTPLYYEELQLPPGSQTFKIRRLKKIGESVLGLETRHLPPEFRDFFSLNELKTTSLLELLRRSSETEVHHITYRTRAALTLEMEAEMMGIKNDRPVLVQHGVFYNRSGKPCMSGRIVYPADKIELHYDVRNSGDHMLAYSK